MDLKNAVAVCLISLFSAALVVLIARSLDNQAASRLEPQLAQIAEELRAIRASGGIPVGEAVSGSEEPLADGLIVYYFHGDVRCPTCEAIESQTLQTVRNDFATQFENGELAWEVRNYQSGPAVDLASMFDVHMANVVLARMTAGEIAKWKRLDQVWALVGDKPAFAEFMRTEIGRMLGEDAQEEPPVVDRVLDLPVPEVPVPPLPQSAVPADLPLPE